MDSLAGVEVTLRNHENQLASYHRTIGELRGVASAHETQIKVMITELREYREDLARVEAGQIAGRKETRAELASIKHTAWAAMTFLITTTVASSGVLIAVLTAH